VGQFAHPAFEPLIWTIALISAFEGVRRIRQGKRDREAIALVASATLLCLLMAGTSFFIGYSMRDLLENEPRFDRELAADWGAELLPEEREKHSRTLAAIAFKSGGKLQPYFTVTGERKLYSPTSADIRERDETVERWTRMSLISAYGYERGVWWLLSTFLAALAGAYYGRRK
jgi:hypothetical protein